MIQDEQGIREKIAKICGTDILFQPDYKKADQILSQTASRGGVCRWCNNEAIDDLPDLFCPACKGTGQTIETKEVGEIIKEWGDGNKT